MSTFIWARHDTLVSRDVMSFRVTVLDSCFISVWLSTCIFILDWSAGFPLAAPLDEGIAVWRFICHREDCESDVISMAGGGGNTFNGKKLHLFSWTQTWHVEKKLIFIFLKGSQGLPLKCLFVNQECRIESSCQFPLNPGWGCLNNTLVTLLYEVTDCFFSLHFQNSRTRNY